ncbi:MAG TPA: hypothetical protein VG737_09550 [Cyclobacteriaceae bacterium]|nr:hypothetical protein [Cyclobacteriaceae bacterium]
MQSIQFWKNWPPTYQRFWWIFFAAFVVALVFTIVSLIQSPAPVFTWQQLQTVKTLDLPAYTFSVGGFELTLFSKNHIIYERWLGNQLHLSAAPLDIYLVLFTVAFTCLLACITILPRFWFLAASGVVVFMISSLGLDALGIFGLYNKIPPIGAMILLIGPAVYFQFLNKLGSFFTRFASFLMAALVAAFVIRQFSQEPNALRYLGINTLPVSIVLLMIFILFVAHEILASFVTLVGQSDKSSKSLQHYLIISSVYLVNLWLTYWNRIGWIDWDFTLNPFLLLCISSILAIWGVRQRQPLYENILDVEPFGVFVVLSIGTVALGVTGYFIATANDIALMSVEDIIIYAHIGFGMMFIMYLASNFMGMMQRNFPVRKVLYKPTVMPYFSYQLGGLVFAIALLSYNGWVVPVNHFISSYYTAGGDHFIGNGDQELAFGYYSRAHFYAPYNQHASTALAELEALRNNPRKEQSYYADANKYRPTAFTLLNEANTLSARALDEVAALQEAHRHLPKDGVIENNLALAYLKIGLRDSCYVYLSRARHKSLTENSASMNMLGLIAESNVSVNLDSVYQASKKTAHTAGNAFALANARHHFIDEAILLPQDSALDLFGATRIGNYLLNHIGKTDTAFLSQCVALGRKPVNRPFAGIVLGAAAHASYACGKVNRAFELMQELAVANINAAKCNTTLALWALNEGKPEVAQMYLTYAMGQGSQDASLPNAITLAETGNLNASIVAWDTVATKKDSTVKVMSESMKRVLGGPASWYDGFTDKEKYRYVRYRIGLDDTVTFDKLVVQIKDENFHARAILDRAKKLFAQDEISRAANMYRKLQGLHLDDVALFSEIKYFELELFASQGFISLVDEQIQKGMMFGPFHETERIFCEALIQHTKGDTVNSRRNFQWLARNNYYFDEGVLAAAAFFSKNDIPKTYAILSEAMQVNGNSVKILKAYIPIAFARGYDNYASGALQTLRTRISQYAFNKYVAENRLSGLLPE